MISKTFGFILISLLVGVTPAAAIEAPQKSKLDTNVSFEDLLIQGKYQFATEAVTTVEQDKVLDSLLSVRKDFRDRLEQSATKY